MKTIFDEPSLSDILSRIDRVAAGAKPKWGKMNAEEMLTHLVNSGRMTAGELACKPKNLPLRFFPLKQLFVYVLPTPKSAPTARELLPSNPTTVERSKEELVRLLRLIAANSAEEGWPEHPAFGRLTRRGWGVLTYRHFDHHLRQFGV